MTLSSQMSLLPLQNQPSSWHSEDSENNDPAPSSSMYYSNQAGAYPYPPSNESVKSFADVPQYVPPCSRLSVKIDGPIGSGAYGKVRSVTDPRDQKLLAVKQISNVFLNLYSAKRVFREVLMLSSFRHENVLGLLDVLRPQSTMFNEIYVLTDLMDTDLHRIISSNQPISLVHVQLFMYQLLRGIKYLHSARIMHRDIKPANLLVSESCLLKICDFGLSRMWNPAQQRRMTYEVVTLYYKPPELLMGNNSYTDAVDVWSAGCIFGELLLRRPLFAGYNMCEQLDLIVDQLGTPSDADMEGASQSGLAQVRLRPRRVEQNWAAKLPMLDGHGLQLLRAMLRFDRRQRVTAEQALQSPYMMGARSYFHATLCFCCPKNQGAVPLHDPEPVHKTPFDPNWDDAFDRCTLFDLRDQLYAYLMQRPARLNQPLSETLVLNDFQQQENMGSFG